MAIDFEWNGRHGSPGKYAASWRGTNTRAWRSTIGSGCGKPLPPIVHPDSFDGYSSPAVMGRDSR